MKHPILLIAFLLLPLMSFSQGVTFEQGSWKDALALAKKTNKPVLLYVFFSDQKYNWYFDPDVNVFSRETVGDVCKTHFVCYKTDASKKEGLALAKKYGLIKWPAVLIVDADGRLLSNVVGSLTSGDAAYFLENLKQVILNLKDPKPITVWEAEYPKKKKDPAFLLEYMDKRYNLGLPINEAFDAYLRLLPTNGPMPEQAAKLFHMRANQLVVTDYAYEYFFNHSKAYKTAIANVYSNPMDENEIFKLVFDHTIDVAIMLEDEALLEKAIVAYKQIPYVSGNKQVEELYMNYYKETEQPDKYLAHARLFAADNLKKLDSEESLREKVETLKNIEEQLASETDSAKINSWNRYKKSVITSGSPLSNVLNGIAWSIFKNYSDEALLKEALTWSEKAVRLYPNTPDYLDTNANLLYKLGRKEEAIALQKRAVANLIGPSDNSALSVTLKKMEVGEKTW